MPTVTMTCMTTKQKFDCEDPPVVVLANGRYAYKVECPWEGKGGKKLHAFKFCSTEAHKEFCARKEEQKEASEEEKEASEEEQTEEPEEP